MGLEGPLPVGLPDLRAVSSRVTTYAPPCLSSTTVRTFLWTGFLGDPKNLVQVGSHSGSKLEERGISETKQRSACGCVHKYSSWPTPHVNEAGYKDAWQESSSLFALACSLWCHQLPATVPMSSSRRAPRALAQPLPSIGRSTWGGILHRASLRWL